MANNQTKASAKWNAKVGYIAKTYKLKKDMVENFQKACEYRGESQASALTRLMNEYSEKAFIDYTEDGINIDDASQRYR